MTAAASQCRSPLAAGRGVLPIERQPDELFSIPTGYASMA